MSSIYTWPINNDMRVYKTPLGKPVYSIEDGGRYDNWNALTDADKIAAGVSPYWGRYEDGGETQSSRTILNGSIEWTPIKDLTFTGKIAYDKDIQLPTPTPNLVSIKTNWTRALFPNISTNSVLINSNPAVANCSRYRDWPHTK